MQGSERRGKVLFSPEELSFLSETFTEYLAVLLQQGFTLADLKILQGILSRVNIIKSNELLDTLRAKVKTLCNEGILISDFLTLSEAAHLYGINSATLRRACWTHELPAEKRGKAWFVNNSDLEQYLLGRKTKGHRK